ncbi:endonuclease III, partial [bacterium]
LREATAPFPQAEMFALRDAGFTSVFEQLVSCILSIRTRDEVSGPAARRLFDVARRPEEIAVLSVEAITERIEPVAFAFGKAAQIREIARRTAEEFGGELPADFGVLTSLKGVGPKCANLTLGVARGVAAVAVDVDVHRVTNRWGYVAAPTPETTMVALEAKLPKEYWVEINERLVPFGKHICTGRLPKCSTCPLLSMCQQVDVTEHR